MKYEHTELRQQQEAGSASAVHAARGGTAQQINNFQTMEHAKTHASFMPRTGASKSDAKLELKRGRAKDELHTGTFQEVTTSRIIIFRL